MKNRTWITFAVAAFVSAAIWALTPILTNFREPWDVDGSFYYVALFLAGGVAGALAPKPLWAHYLGSFAGQLGYELLFLRVGPLVIIGAVMLAVYCLVFVIGAGSAGFLRRRICPRTEESS